MQEDFERDFQTPQNRNDGELRHRLQREKGFFRSFLSTSGDRIFAAFTSFTKILGIVAIALVRGYQYLISPLMPPSCRFSPTCSQYMIEAIQRYGFLRGLYLGIRRILRCHPFHPGGYDPVK